jgi:hypothetical protein
MCHMRLLQSASFFIPTLGDELRLLTTNTAMNSEPLAHNNAPNSSFGQQLVTNHQGVNIAGTLHQGTSPHWANAAHNNTRLTLPAMQPLVNTWSSTGQHTTAAHSVFTTIKVLGHSI